MHHLRKIPRDATDITVFQNFDCLSSLPILVNFTSHLNKLNLQFQKNKQFIHDMLNHSLTFETKLRLWEFQIN